MFQLLFFDLKHIICSVSDVVLVGMEAFGFAHEGIQNMIDSRTEKLVNRILEAERNMSSASLHILQAKAQ